MPRRTFSVSDLAASAANVLGRGLDAAIGAVSPEAGLRRKVTREMYAVADKQSRRFAEREAERAFSGGGDYYAGSRSDPMRDGRWLTSELSPNSYLEQGLHQLHIRAQDLYANFEFAAGAIDGRCDNVIGTGMSPNARIVPTADEPEGASPRLDVPRITQAEADLWNNQLEHLWQQWAEYAGGRAIDFGEVIDSAYRGHLLKGDSLVVLGAKDLPSKPIPLHLSVVEAVRLDTPPDQMANPLCRLGVQLDADGDAIGFHVRRSHPGETKGWNYTFDYFRAERVCHLLRRKWPDQTRGLPWLAPITIAARDYADWKESTIITGQMAALLGVIVKTKTSALNQAIGRASSTSNNTRFENWNPGQVRYLSDAEDISVINPNHPSTTFGMFAEWQLLAMAAGLDWPFGWLVKDRRRATYSAGRLEEIDGGVKIRVDQKNVTRKIGAPVWREFVRQCYLAGLVSFRPELVVNHFHLLSAHVWQCPARPWVDPETEVNAFSKAVDNNMMSLAEVVTGRNVDVEQLLAVRARERQLERDLDIVPASQTAATAKLVTAVAAQEAAGAKGKTDPPPAEIDPAAEDDPPT